MKIKTPFDNQIKEQAVVLKEAKTRLNNLERSRDEYYISHIDELIPVEKYEEYFEKVKEEITRKKGVRFGGEIIVAFVAKQRREWENDFSGPLVIYADDAEGCEWPRIRDGRFYWNTYNCGIVEWNDEEQSYVWWRHHSKTYLDILGFAAIEPDPSCFPEED